MGFHAGFLSVFLPVCASLLAVHLVSRTTSRWLVIPAVTFYLVSLSPFAKLFTPFMFVLLYFTLSRVDEKGLLIPNTPDVPTASTSSPARISTTSTRPRTAGMAVPRYPYYGDLTGPWKTNVDPSAALQVEPLPENTLRLDRKETSVLRRQKSVLEGNVSRSFPVDNVFPDGVFFPDFDLQ